VKNGLPYVCACGHTNEAHLHWRRGKDCSVCDCKAFNRPGSLDWMAVAIWIGAPIISWALVIATVFGLVKLVQHFL
jgi:hypothetical protein